MKSRYQTARKWLIFWTLFIGIGAVAGAACMLIEPSGSIMGMDAMLPYFQVLPFASVLFQNFTFSGIALLIVNGLTNLTAAALLLMDRRSGAVLGGDRRRAAAEKPSCRSHPGRDIRRNADAVDLHSVLYLPA